jgi:hypothetical protein
MHIIVNAALLFGCFSVAVAGTPGGVTLGGTRFHSVIPESLAVPAWLALAALLFSNAIFHLVGTWTTKRISPGVRTGTILYVPLAVAGYAYFLSTGRVSAVAAAVSALVGGSYHLWAAMAHRWRAGGSGADV